MPLYEYECKKCLKRFEKLQKIGENGDSVFCPQYGEKRPKKLISSFSSTSSCGNSGFS